MINRITDDDLQDFLVKPVMTEYQRIATKSAIYPGQGTPTGLQYAALKLNGEAGELAEHVGKAMRDDSFGVTREELTDRRRLLIIKELGDVLWYVGAICNEIDIALFDVALANLQKLKDRTDRDKLQGSGDER